MQVEEIPKQSRNSLLKTAFNATSFLKARENFFLFFLYSILLYMKKLSNTLNHSNKLMSTFFCAVKSLLRNKTFERNVPFGIVFTFERFFL